MLNGLVNTRDVMKLWYFIQQRNVMKLVFHSATIVQETSNINLTVKVIIKYNGDAGPDEGTVISFQSTRVADT